LERAGFFASDSTSMIFDSIGLGSYSPMRAAIFLRTDALSKSGSAIIHPPRKILRAQKKFFWKKLFFENAE
jgi:hypothetical protein